MATAQDVFINHANLLTGIIADIIYNIPIFTFHSPAGVLRRTFDANISLPMINPFDIPGQKTPGFDTIKEIIHQRVERSTVEADAVNLLVEKTGGVLQHAFEVLQTAASMTSAEIPLRKEHIGYGLQRKRNEFWSEITLPLCRIRRSKDWIPWNTCTTG